MLERALDHEEERIQEAAGEGLVRLAGIDDPFRFVCRQVEEHGIESLTSPQRVVYFANVFEHEVCNGGLMQLFGNSSGGYVREALTALHEVRHEDAERALVAAVDAVGPLVFEREHVLRMAAFEDRYDELVEMFRPLEEAFYRSTGLFRQKVLLYAAAHAAQFGGG